MNEHTPKPLWLYAVKGAATAALVLLVKLLLTIFTFLYYSANSAFNDSDLYLIYIVIFVASLFVYNSVIGVFQTFDPPSAAEYLIGKGTQRSGFARIYGYRSFLLEYTVATAVLAISAALGLFPEIAGMFYTGEGFSPYKAGILPLGAAILIFSLFYFLRRYEATRYWDDLEEKGRPGDLGGKRTVAIRFLFILVLYPTVLPYFPILLYLPAVLLAIFGAVSNEITAFGAVAVIVGIVLVLWGAKVLFSLLRRRKFIHRIEQTARQCGYELSSIENPYRSLFSRDARCRFDLTFKNTTYHCRIIGNQNRRVPICFSSATEGYYRYRLGTKKHHITLSIRFDYEIEGDGKKILILAPTPKRALITEGEREKVLFNADPLWDTVVYEADAFIGAAERYCLGRFDANRP